MVLQRQHDCADLQRFARQPRQQQPCNLRLQVRHDLCHERLLREQCLVIHHASVREWRGHLRLPVRRHHGVIRLLLQQHGFRVFMLLQPPARHVQVRFGFRLHNQPVLLAIKHAPQHVRFELHCQCRDNGLLQLRRANQEHRLLHEQCLDRDAPDLHLRRHCHNRLVLRLRQQHRPGLHIRTGVRHKRNLRHGRLPGPGLFLARLLLRIQDNHFRMVHRQRFLYRPIAMCHGRGVDTRVRLPVRWVIALQRAFLGLLLRVEPGHLFSHPLPAAMRFIRVRY